jgi:hypothetical protein
MGVGFHVSSTVRNADGLQTMPGFARIALKDLILTDLQAIRAKDFDSFQKKEEKSVAWQAKVVRRLFTVKGFS